MPAPQPPEVTRWCMLFISLVSLVGAVLMAYSVIEFERTGRAPYSENPSLPDKLSVSKTKDTAKFNQVIGVATFRALIYGSAAVASFYFYRRLSN